VEIRKQYERKSQTGLQLQITYVIAGYKQDLENIRGNSKTSAKDRVGQYNWNQHKPRFDKEC